MDKKKINESTKKIREAADEIDEEVADKTAKTYGDPVCEIEY